LRISSSSLTTELWPSLQIAVVVSAANAWLDKSAPIATTRSKRKGNILSQGTSSVWKRNLPSHYLVGYTSPSHFAQIFWATPAQIALAWLLTQKPWIVPIPGTTNLAPA
jgi:aryl-alcohol dehydrogenase-like predicted oxidoreductase